MSEYTEKEIYEACESLELSEFETYFATNDRRIDYDENGELILGQIDERMRIYRMGPDVFVDDGANNYISFYDIDKFISALKWAKRDAQLIKKLLDKNRQNKRKEEEDEE